jgi:hypothetical protein
LAITVVVVFVSPPGGKEKVTANKSGLVGYNPRQCITYLH